MDFRRLIIKNLYVLEVIFFSFLTLMLWELVKRNVIRPQKCFGEDCLQIRVYLQGMNQLGFGISPREMRCCIFNCCVASSHGELCLRDAYLCPQHGLWRGQLARQVDCNRTQLCPMRPSHAVSQIYLSTRRFVPNFCMNKQREFGLIHGTELYLHGRPYCTHKP